MLRTVAAARHCAKFFTGSRRRFSSTNHSPPRPQANAELRVIAEALRSRPIVDAATAANQPLYATRILLPCLIPFNPRTLHLHSHVALPRRFVFLEGATCVGKSKVTSRLQQMGYSVHHENFIELCARNPQFPPQSLVMQTKWTAELVAGDSYEM